MAADRPDKAGRVHPEGYWGQYRGVKCAADGCEQPAKCKGLCGSHYGKARWAAGHRAPSTLPGSRARRSTKLKHRYGITLDQYEQLLADQNDACAICLKSVSEVINPSHWSEVLCVDHCHDSGAVRGLLCNDCNLLVARGHNADILRRASEYLERHA